MSIIEATIARIDAIAEATGTRPRALPVSILEWEALGIELKKRSSIGVMPSDQGIDLGWGLGARAMFDMLTATREPRMPQFIAIHGVVIQTPPIEARERCPKCGRIVPTAEEHERYRYAAPQAYPKGFCWRSCIGEESACKGDP